jgi:serine protein kinase
VSTGHEIVNLVAEQQDLEQFRRKNWVGTFSEYLDLVKSDSRVMRNAFQRVHDMIMSYGTRIYEMGREQRVHFNFFDDPDNDGRDAVFGLDEALQRFVHALESAARGYGIEKRVLLLHGPVGSSKSTIARLLKAGLERYSQTDAGALYTLGWADEHGNDVHWCPMHEEPLHLIPERFREDVCRRLNASRAAGELPVSITGELDPFCRFMYADRLRKYDGDWTRLIQDVRVKRLILSEKDRVGIGTFQPKDEK